MPAVKRIDTNSAYDNESYNPMHVNFYPYSLMISINFDLV